MADERGYESQVAPRAVQLARAPGPEAFGAGVGEAIGQAGQELHARQIRSYKIDRALAADREASDFAHKFALHRQNMDDIVRLKRTEPSSPDYAGHVEEIATAEQAARESLLAGITEDSVRARATMQLDEYALRLRSGESEFAEGQRVAKTVLDNQEITRIDANLIRRGTTGAEFTVAMKSWAEHVDGLNGLTPVQKEKLKSEGWQERAVAYGNHLIDTNPEGAKFLIAQGSLDEWLEPRQIEALINGADVEIRRIKAAEEHKANVARATYKDQLGAAETDSSQGIDIGERIPALLQAAQAAGDQSDIARIEKLGRDAVFAKAYTSLPAREWENRIRALNTKGDLDANEQAEREYLTSHLSAHSSRLAQDPAGEALKAGVASPPMVDLETGEGFADLARWGRATGNSKLFTKDQARELAEEAQNGPGGYKAVLSRLALIPDSQRRAAVRQVLPGDAYAEQVAMLDEPIYRRVALDGRAALKDRPKLITAEDPDEAEEIDDLRASLHAALRAVPMEQRVAVLQVADSMAAYYAAQNGGKEGELLARTYRTVLNMALGAEGNGADRRGGIGDWFGNPVLIPDGMKERSFGVALGNILGTNNGKLWPRNPDGSKIPLRAMVPVAQGGGNYRFFVGRDVVRGKDGKPLTITVKLK